MTHSAGRAWSGALDARARLLQDQLVDLSKWADEMEADETTREMLLAPIRVLIAEVYGDSAIAKLADESELLVRLSGPAADVESPRVSLLANVFGQYRNQIARVTKAILGAAAPSRVPSELDLGFAGFAPGSIYVGFVGPTPDREEIFPAVMEADPWVGATHKAIYVLGEAARIMASDGNEEELRAVIPDETTRETTLSAIQQLAPSGHQGIDAVSLSGRGIAKPVALTKETRRSIRARFARTHGVGAAIVAIGTVREIDLDDSSFELRDVRHAHDGNSQADLRCSYDLDEGLARTLLNHRVRVSGRLDPKGRSFIVEDLEPLD